MNKYLEIEVPQIIKESGKARLESKIFNSDSKQEYNSFIEVDEKYSKYFSFETSDYLLVTLLLYGMQHDYDLHFVGDLSEELYFKITNYLIPAISQNIKKYHPITITCAKLVTINYDGKHISTGLSCGVDSFYTIYKGLSHSEESGLKLNSLSFFNAGATGMYGGDKARDVYLERLKRFKNVAQKLECDFICVDTNFSEYLHQNHEATHVFRTLCIPFALQKYYKKYYFSSSYPYNKFKFDAFDPSLYDLLNVFCLSTSNITFESVGGETTRLGKLKYISDFELTKHELNVCIDGVENCNHCTKCKRTMLDLFLLGKLDEYKDVFDVDYFYKNKKKFFRWALRNVEGVDMDEIVIKLIKNHDVSITTRFVCSIERFFIYLFKLTKKIAKKILRYESKN